MTGGIGAADRGRELRPAEEAQHVGGCAFAAKAIFPRRAHGLSRGGVLFVILCLVRRSPLSHLFPVSRQRAQFNVLCDGGVLHALHSSCLLALNAEHAEHAVAFPIPHWRDRQAGGQAGGQAYREGAGLGLTPSAGYDPARGPSRHVFLGLL